MNRKERELISAVSKVARDQITDYSRQHSFAIGTVKGLTLSGAAVQILDSGRFERNVPAVRGAELVLDTQVLLARVGRMGWVILGSVEPGGSTTQTIDTAVPAAGVAGLTATNYPDHVELRWTASYFDIQCYEVMANTSESETGATTYVTDNTQFLYYDDWGTYYFKVRAVGPNWDRGSWSAWTEADIDHRWDLGSDPSWPYRLSFGHYDASWIELFAIGSNGTILFTKIAAPDDSEFDFSQFSFWFDDTPDATALHLKGKDSDEVVVNKEIHLVGDSYDSDLRVGVVTEDIDGAGYGKKIYLSGGKSVDGTWDSDNSDELWMARYNVANDETELRLNVGDNGTAADALVIGYTETGTWYPLHRFQLDGSVKPYGSCYGNHIGWLQENAVDDTWYNISDSDMASGPLYLVTHDGDGELTVTEAGQYLVTYSLCFYDDVANNHIEVGIEVSNSGAAEAAGRCHVENKFASQEEHLGGGTILTLDANATIEIAIRTTDAGTPDISVTGVNLSVVRVG